MHSSYVINQPNAMLLRSAIVLFYIISCVLLRARPWRYFQLNAAYFNQEKGLFSKQEINDLIPKKWQLAQYRDDGVSLPATFPVFVKPEWGQNSLGVHRVENAKQLAHLRSLKTASTPPNLIQQAGTRIQEIEIFYINANLQQTMPSVLSITQVVNDSGNPLPVNGIDNPHTHYCDITKRLNPQQTRQLWQHLRSMGPFHIARVGVNTDCLEQLLAGDFSVIEINLFVPLPLSFLCPHIGWQRKIKLLFAMTWALAKATKALPLDAPSKKIFFTKWQLSWQLSRQKGV